MNVGRTLLSITAGTLAVCATGCLMPKPGPVSRFYQLQPVPFEAASSALPRTTSIRLGPIEVSPYLDHPQMVTRVSKHEVLYDENRRWAEPLRRNISWALCENLTKALGTNGVYPFTAVSVPHDAVSVPVQITRLEKRQEGDVLLVATWSVITPESKQEPVVRHARISKPVAGQSMEYAIAAQSELLAELSRMIAEDVVRSVGAGQEE